MKAILPTKAQFDSLAAQMEAFTRDWAERECTTFDEAVRRAAGVEPEPSIWDMPAIDSKCTVALLVELETLIGGGCKLPATVIKSGGYRSADDLVRTLLPTIRERCPDADKPGIAATAATPPLAQVLP